MTGIIAGAMAGQLVPEVLVPDMLLDVGLGCRAGRVVPAHVAAPPLHFFYHILQQKRLHSWPK